MFFLHWATSKLDVQHGGRLLWVGGWNRDIHCRINTALLWIYFTRISSILIQPFACQLHPLVCMWLATGHSFHTLTTPPTCNGLYCDDHGKKPPQSAIFFVGSKCDLTQRAQRWHKRSCFVTPILMSQQLMLIPTSAMVGVSTALSTALTNSRLQTLIMQSRTPSSFIIPSCLKLLVSQQRNWKSLFYAILMLDQL